MPKVAGLLLLLLLAACSGSGNSPGSSSPPVNNSPPAGTPQSRYFLHDAEATQVLRGERSLRLPTQAQVDEVGSLQWRIVNALRMNGSELAELTTGRLIDAAAFREIDRVLAQRENLFDRDAAKLPNYAAIWAPQFRDNVHRTYSVHLMVRLFELFNAGSRQYQRFTNRCVLANLMPLMCGALVDMGTVEGWSCRDLDAPAREPAIVQFPDLHGFWNVRREVLVNELPNSTAIPWTCVTVATMAHEFAHDLDQSFFFGDRSAHDVHFERRQECSTELFDFARPGHPFVFSGAPGTQVPGDYVSAYAAGLSNPGQDYRHWEDAAESVTAYMLFPEYFRAHALQSPSLRARYDYIRTHLFAGVEFTNPTSATAMLPIPSGASVANLCFDIAALRLDEIRTR